MVNFLLCQTSSVRAVLPSLCAQFLPELRFTGQSQSHHWPKLLWQKHLPETGEEVNFLVGYRKICVSLFSNLTYMI